MPSAYSIPKVYEEEIEGVIEAGYYSNKSEVVRDALRLFFEQKQMLRVAASIEMFKKGKVSLARAAELAGLTSIEFKDILAERGIKTVVLKKGLKEAKKQMRLLEKVRSAK